MNVRMGRESEREPGGSPNGIAQCAECEEVYPMRRTASGDLHPVGTDGRCICGNDEFRVIDG